MMLQSNCQIKSKVSILTDPKIESKFFNKNKLEGVSLKMYAIYINLKNLKKIIQMLGFQMK